MKKIILSFFLIATSLFAQDPALTLNATFTGTTALSTPINLRNCSVGGFIIPTGWSAANLTFRISNDGGVTYGELKDEYNTTITVTVGSATNVIQLTFADWFIFKNRYLIIRSGTVGTPVNQTNLTVKVLCGR